MTNKKQDATPKNVATGGNVGRYDNVARQSTAKRNDNTVIKVNVERCDKYISYLQPQLVNLINELTKLYNNGDIIVPTHYEEGIETFSKSIQMLFNGGHKGKLMVRM